MAKADVNEAPIQEALAAPEAEIPADPARPAPRFEDVFREHHKSIVYYFGRLGASAEECRDLAQETFTKAFKGIAGYRREAQVKTWLHKIARHVWLNRTREQAAAKRQVKEVPLHGARDDDDEMEVSEELGAGVSLSPEDRLLMAERLARLAAALARLSPQRRRCVYLRVQGYKYKEIAALMGITIQGVRPHLHQARAQLRELLGEDFDDWFQSSKTEMT